MAGFAVMEQTVEVWLGAYVSNGISAPSGSAMVRPDTPNGMVAGSIWFGSGIAPSSGSQVAVMVADLEGSRPARVRLRPLNTATAALEPYISMLRPSCFTISFAHSPRAKQSADTYALAFTIE
jgi:hypothetical protein